MNSAKQEATPKELLGEGVILSLLHEYLLKCYEKGQEDEPAASRRKERSGLFPNLAGFCRFLGVGVSELEELLGNDDKIYDRILAILEDEALNSTLSPTLLSSYLKKRLGYEKSLCSPTTSQLQIHFEHDIYEDGE